MWGQYITHLVDNLDVLTPHVRDSLTLVGYLDYIERILLNEMKVRVRGEGKGEYFWNETPVASDGENTYGTPFTRGAESSGHRAKKRKWHRMMTCTMPMRSYRDE